MRASQIVREIKRRKIQERLRDIRPIRPDDPNPNYPDIACNDQLGFLMSEAKIRAAFGGNRSCKSETGAIDSCWFAQGKHPVRSKHRQPPIYGRICAPKYEKNVKGVLLKKFRSMIPHCELLGSRWVKAWSESSKTLTWANGSQFNFLSGEMDLDVYGCDDIDFFWIDEHIDYNRFTECVARTVDRAGYGMLTMTPEAGQTWEEDFITSPPKVNGTPLTVDYWFFTTYGNPYLAKEGIETFEATLTDPRKKEAKILGHFMALGGMVYPMYNSAHLMTPDFEIPQSWFKVCLIDPHLRKFTAILWMAWSPDGDPFVYRTRKVKKIVSELATYIRAQSINDGQIDLWIGDEAMGGEGKNIFGEESVLVQLNNLGLPFQPTSTASDKAFEAGVNTVQMYITPEPVSNSTRLKIFQSCSTAIEWIDGKVTGSIFWEFKRYRFRKEGKADEETFREHVANVDDDLITLLRYGLVAGPGSRTPVTVSMSQYPEPVDGITGW